MRFGWLTLSLSPSPEEDAARIDQQIEQVRVAEQLGFGDVWLTEHYFTGESVYNDALLFASAVAMRTETIRIGFAVVELPFHHPVRLAVQLALLDNLSKGRIDVGVGKGTIYNEYEFVGHGLRSDDSRERMEEARSTLSDASGAATPSRTAASISRCRCRNCGLVRYSAPTCRYGAA
jgi:alkanesulfonate monooxygenase SsuD/methylene tetrahydromethanopterin reductase-like flavin-dependent oxidoreductase (luciferase family)